MRYQRAYASEIDPYAMGVAHYNHTDVYQMGDVLGIDKANYCFDFYNERERYVHKGIDLLLAGVPCQPFSFAGNQLAFNDERAKPTIEFFKLFHKWKPKWWLVEETPMKKEYQDIFSREFGCEPRVHNSASVSAQNRKRLYWTNIPHDDLPNLGINLEDILEDESMTDREKAYCIDANYFKGGSMKMYFEKSRRQLVFNHDQKCKQVGEADLKGYDIIKRVYDRKHKSPALTTMQGGWRMPKVVCGAWRGRYLVDGVRQDHKMKTAGLTTQRLEVRKDTKTNTLTTVQKDNVAVNTDELYWRALTVKECERLQTMPDDYTKYGSYVVDYSTFNRKRTMSNSRRYKMIGNGWTVDVIKHILNGIPEQSLGTVVSLFDGCGCGFEALKGVKR